MIRTRVSISGHFYESYDVAYPHVVSQVGLLRANHQNQGFIQLLYCLVYFVFLNPCFLIRNIYPLLLKPCPIVHAVSPITYTIKIEILSDFILFIKSMKCIKSNHYFHESMAIWNLPIDLWIQILTENQTYKYLFFYRFRGICGFIIKILTYSRSKGLYYKTSIFL